MLTHRWPHHGTHTHTHTRRERMGEKSSICAWLAPPRGRASATCGPLPPFPSVVAMRASRRTAARERPVTQTRQQRAEFEVLAF